MNGLLTPKEVDELRPANEPKELMRNTKTTRLISTIDALVEALLMADQALEECPDPRNCDCSTAIYLRSGPRSRVAEWLERDNAEG